MKRIVSLLMALAILLSMTPGITLHVHAEETESTSVEDVAEIADVPVVYATVYPTLKVGTATKTSTLEEDESEYYSFVPETTDSYTFYSTGADDSKGYLYLMDETGSLKWLATNDDGGEDNNFSITYVLEAGNTYVLEAMNYEEDDDWFYVYVQVNHDGQRVIQTAATCQAEGLQTYVCDNCQQTFEEIIPIAPHNYVNGKCKTCGGVPYAVASGKCGAGDSWTLYDSGELNIIGSTDMYVWQASSEVPWNNYRDQIKKVTINNGVTTLGAYAFYNCANLTDVSLPSSITSIGEYAFCNCTGVTDITLPDALNYIGSSAFFNTGLKFVFVPENVYNICSYAFGGCKDLLEINVSANNTTYTSRYGVLFRADMSQLYQYPMGKVSTYEGESGVYCIPEGVTMISEAAFYRCADLKRIIFPGSLEYIGMSAFSGCTGLTELELPSKLWKIDEWAFSSCSFDYVKFYPSLYQFVSYAFSNASVGAVYYGGSAAQWANITFSTQTYDSSSNNCIKNNSNVYYKAFGSCGDNVEYNIRDGVLTISGSGPMTDFPDNNSSSTYTQQPWYDVKNKITAVVVEDGVTSIGNYAFYEINKISSVSIGKDVKVIGKNAFYYCNEGGMSQIVLPEGLTTVRDGAFWGCTKLTSITIPSTVTSIGASAFKYCDRLNTVTFLGNFPNMASTGEQFYNLPAMTVYYPANNSTWSSGVRLNYGNNRTVTWIATCGNHAFNADGITYTWSGDNSVCTASWACSNNGCQVTKASQKATAQIEVLQAATCEASGNANYTAAFTVEGFETQTKSAVLPATGHSYEAVVTAPTCEEGGYTTYTCENCGDSYVSDYTEAAGHDWNEWNIIIEATCTSDGYRERTCKVCGNGEMGNTPTIDHIYSESVTDVTCTSDGYTTFTCEACGYSYEDFYVISSGHSYDSVTNNPTCEDDGSTVYTCSACGDSYSEVHAAIGHNYQAVITAPTCENCGYTTYSCENCGDSYVANEVEALGHEYSAIVTAPTCEADGYTTYTCGNCGDTYVDDVVPTAGHVAGGAVKENDVPATCENAGGYDTVIYCSSCSVELSRSHTALNAKGHSWNEGEITTAPTCTENGIRTSYCANDPSHTFEEIVEAFGHDDLEPVIENEVAPTCENAGGYDTVVYCNICGGELGRNHTELEATGHEWDAGVVTTDPTCTGKGVTTFTCIKDASHTYTEEFEELGHSEDGFVTENEIAPSCENIGGYDEVIYCSVCGDELRRRHIEVAATGHAWDEGVITVDSTCTGEGVKTFTCGNDATHTYTETIAALGHTAAEAVKENNVAPTCENVGGYDMVVYCTVCSEKLSSTHTEVAATGHSYKSVVTAPTCTAEGYTTHTCAVCGDSYVDSKVAAKGHSYTSKKVDATCTKDGSITYTCACGHSYVETIPASGHSYKSVVTASTCTEAGYTTYICACGHSYKGNYTAIKDHSYGNWVTTKEATCTADGTQKRSCANCSASETQTIAAKGHSYTSKVIESTCTEAGYTTYTCTCGNSYKGNYTAIKDHSYDNWVTTKEATCTADGTQKRICSACSASETKSIAAKGHSYTSKATAATCTAQGYTTYTCACGSTYKDNYTAAKGHSYGSWTTTKAATCTAEGTQKRTCTACSASETKSIAAKGHSYTSKVTAATCTAQGYTTYTCACGSTYKDNYTAAKDHFYGSWTTTKAATCTADGTQKRTCANCTAYETKSIAAKGHSYTSKATAATCTAQGYTTYTCTCGSTYKDNYTAAKGHSYGSWTTTKAATCTTEGTQKRTCSACSAYETKSIAAKGHSYTSKVTAATCTAQGYTTYTCACGSTYKDNYTAAKGHSYGSWTTTKAATCTAEGTQKRTCTACSASETKSIAAKGHSYTSKVTAATCTAQGYTTYTCACGSSYKDNYTAVVDHQYNKGVCAVCGDVTTYVEAPTLKSANDPVTGKIKLTWNEVDGATKYKVYRATSKNGKYSRRTTTSKTSFTNSNAVAGKYYYYYVVAIAEDGTESAKSNTVGRTCDLAQTKVTLSNNTSTGKIKISWEAVEGATKYQVYRSTSRNGTYTRISTTSGTSITNTSAVAGKTYYYKVRAICDKDAATAAYSDVVSRTCDLPKPDVSISRSSGKPKVSWQKVDGAVSYRVYRATSKNGSYSLVKTTTSRSFKDTKAKKGKTYYYKVIAVCSNTAGNSAYSNVVSIKATK